MSNDDKMARILARAAQMQQARDDEDRLGQLEDAAAEVGIDRALVRRAALEQSLDAVEPPRMLGVPTRVVRRRWIAADISVPETRTHLLARLDAIFGAKGERVEDEAHATWTARHIVVTFEGQGEGTLVQVSERFVNTTSTALSLGATLGLAAGAMTAIFTLAVVGKGLLAGLLAAPIVMACVGLGVQLGRSRTLATIANAQSSFERALDSIEATRKSPALRTENGAHSDVSVDSD